MAHKKMVSTIDKFFIGFIITFIIALVWYFEQENAIEWMKQYYPVYVLYDHIYTQFAERTLLGLLYASFFGSLFFIFLPIELIYIYYNELPYSKALVFAIVIFGNLLGQMVNYATGRAFGLRLVQKILKDQFEKFAKMLMKYGGWIIFIGNVILFPIEPVSVVIGAGKYPFKRFLLLTFLGKVIKFTILLIASSWASQHLVAFI